MQLAAGDLSQAERESTSPFQRPGEEPKAVGKPGEGVKRDQGEKTSRELLQLLCTPLLEELTLTGPGWAGWSQRSQV